MHAGTVGRTLERLVQKYKREAGLSGTSDRIFLRKQGDNTPPTSEYILLMSWAAQVTTKQEICFLMYTYISTILLLGEYA